MRVALYARGDRDPSAEPILATLTAYAAERGWEIAQEHTDQDLHPTKRRDGLSSLIAAVKARTIQAILVRTLSHLARSLRHLTDLGHLLTVHEVALIAIEDHLDTTEPGGALRWRDWLDISTRLDRQLRAEAAKQARRRSPGERWGRPAAAVNPLELQTWWEGRGGRRPLFLRELAQKLGVSEATVRKHLRALRAAGKLNDEARARALTTRGGHRKGGRPANPLNDDTLTAAWSKKPSIAAVARNLHVRPSRVRARLQEIGLIPVRTRATPLEVPVHE